MESIHIATAVVIYDWFLTIPDELRLIQRHKATGAKVLFLANRYFFIFSEIFAATVCIASGLSNAVSLLEMHSSSEL